MLNAYAQYQQNSVFTASPAELTLMLYDGLVKFIRQGKLFIEKREIENAHNSIIRAQAIVGELNTTLDMSYDIAKNLRSLYDFMQERLLQANLQKDTGILDDVLWLAQELRDTWKEAMEKARKGARG